MDQPRGRYFEDFEIGKTFVTPARAAAACAGFCRAELNVIRSAFGSSVSITRGEHILNGGRRCTYVIREQRAGMQGTAPSRPMEQKDRKLAKSKAG